MIIYVFSLVATTNGGTPNSMVCDEKKTAETRMIWRPSDRNPTAWALTPAPELSWNGMEINDLFTSAFPQQNYKNI